MKTHSVENYHVCPYLECGKRYINESKLRTHMKTHHDKVAYAYLNFIQVLHFLFHCLIISMCKELPFDLSYFCNIVSFKKQVWTLWTSIFCLLYWLSQSFISANSRKLSWLCLFYFHIHSFITWFSDVILSILHKRIKWHMHLKFMSIRWDSWTLFELILIMMLTVQINLFFWSFYS